MGARRERTSVRRATIGFQGELVERAPWDVAIGISQSGFRTQIVLERLGLTLAAPDDGPEELAVWDVMCRLERMLRERRDEIAARGRRAHIALLDVG